MKKRYYWQGLLFPSCGRRSYRRVLDSNYWAGTRSSKWSSPPSANTKTIFPFENIFPTYIFVRVTGCIFSLWPADAHNSDFSDIPASTIVSKYIWGEQNQNGQSWRLLSAINLATQYSPDTCCVLCTHESLSNLRCDYDVVSTNRPIICQ